MPTATLSLELDETTARLLAEASPERRSRVELLLKMRLRELVTAPPRPLSTVMDEIGDYAETQGLTPELLETLLHDD
jgi:hypothetical protein